MLAKNTAKLRDFAPLYNQPIRNFSIVAPESKLHFINHPRYGPVYPIVSVNEKYNRFGLGKLSIVMNSIVNTSILY